MGTSRTPAISAYDNSSTSRSHTACLNASGRASSAAWRSASSDARVSSCSGENSCDGVRRRLLDDLAVDVDRVPAVVPSHVAEGVVKDREQPRLQVRPALKLRGRPERFQIRVLDQVLGIGRPPGQPHRGPVQAVDVGQGLAREPVRAPGCRPSPGGRGRRCPGRSPCRRCGRETSASVVGGPWSKRTPTEGEHRGGGPLFLSYCRGAPPPLAAARLAALARRGRGRFLSGCPESGTRRSPRVTRGASGRSDLLAFRSSTAGHTACCGRRRGSCGVSCPGTRTLQQPS